MRSSLQLLDQDKSPPIPRSLSDSLIRSVEYSKRHTPAKVVIDSTFKNIRDIKLNCEGKISMFTTSDAEIVSEYAILRCNASMWNIFQHNDDISIIVYKAQESARHSIFAKGRVIGKGQEGIVYLGQDLTSKTIKMIAIKERSCTTRLSKKSCLNEYKILEYLTYARGFLIYDTIHYMFMDYFYGFNASDIPESWSNDLRQAVACGMLRALQSIHNVGILHGDVKPDNFIIEYQLSWIAVKLIDFGQAVFMNFRTNKILGAPAYQPPECRLLDPPLRSQKTEFYSVAICQLETLSHHSFLMWQCDRERFDSYLHEDLEKCCYDVFLNTEELTVLQQHNPWRYELLKIAYKMYTANIDDRADVNEVVDAIDVIDKLESEYVKKLIKSMDSGKILSMRKKRTMQKLDLKAIYKIADTSRSCDNISTMRESSSSPKNDSSRSTSSSPLSGSASPNTNSPISRLNSPSVVKTNCQISPPDELSPRKSITQTPISRRKRTSSLVQSNTK